MNSIISYYPKYSFLDSIFSNTKTDKCVLYVDLKGIMGNLYTKWTTEFILTNSQGTNVIDTSIFYSVLEFISFHKKWAKKRNIKLGIVFFYEKGDSSYHKDIYPGYKANRKLRKFFGLSLDEEKLFSEIFDKNLNVINHFTNYIPKVCTIGLDFFEADFIPWYVKERIISDKKDEYNHLIYSTDKDMLQCLTSSNDFMFYRHSGSTKMITYESAASHYFKADVDKEYSIFFTLFLAIAGDSADDFKGVYGVAGKSILKNLKELISSVGGSMDKVFEAVKLGTTIFPNKISDPNRVLKLIYNYEEAIVRNLKLCSYKLLSDFLDSDYHESSAKTRAKIEKTVNNPNKVTNPRVMVDSLDKSGLGDDDNIPLVYSLF